MTIRIASLALAALFLATPIAAGAADGCGGCCQTVAAPDPCQAEPIPCETASRTTCCEQAPAAALPDASRFVELPVPDPIAVTPRPVPPKPARASEPTTRPDLVARTSALRLSVVLRI